MSDEGKSLGIADEVRRSLAALDEAADSAFSKCKPTNLPQVDAPPARAQGLVLDNKKVDVERIKALASTGNREELLSFLTSTLESLEHDKENAYAVATRILQSSGYAVDPFTLAALAKFIEVAGKSSSEVNKVVKMIQELAMQWTIIDLKSKEGEDGYADYAREDAVDPLSEHGGQK